MDSTSLTRASTFRESEEVAETESVVGAQVPELERLRLRNLVMQQQLLREQLNVLTLQFLQTTQPRTLQQRLDDVAARISSIVEKLFADAKVDPQRYQLNVDDGLFVERSVQS